jgi:hypothetical protein
MKSGLTYLIFVIDRSGSMATIRDDMIGGFNTFIKTQKDAKLGDCKVFAYKFDNIYEAMFEDVDLNDVPQLDRTNYVPRDMTALYDAVATTIDNMGARLAAMKEEDRPEKVLVVTITDGEENASRKFNQQNVADRIKTQREQFNWDFAYIGANQDSWQVGSSIGYQAGTTLDYVADSGGTAFAFQKLCASTSNYRGTKGAKFAFTPDDDDKKAASTKSKSKKVA